MLVAKSCAFSVAGLYKPSIGRGGYAKYQGRISGDSWPLGNPFHPFRIGEPHCATQIIFMFSPLKIIIFMFILFSTTTETKN
jgi:hypothetical protein